VDLWQAVGFGAVGGLIVELMSMWGYLTVWQAARRDYLEKDKYPLPKLTQYLDPPADGLVALTRLLMGAGAGALLHVQVSGPIAAIAVGATAPALFKQIGKQRPPLEPADGQVVSP
jgi:hypothetical protein